ncbi:DUF5711 family protein [Lachnospiraceae bacterium ZAX-1]
MSKKPYRILQTDVDVMNKKIRVHRMRVLRYTIILIIIILAAVAGFYWYYQTRTYASYDIIQSAERKDAAGTKFIEFGENIIKYSNGGAICIDRSNHLIWNQTYDMQDPAIDICKEYAVIADQGGNQIFIMNMVGNSGSLETTAPIQQVHVADQGMVAVLMDEEDARLIEMYDRKGKFLVRGELHTEKGGYPLDITISDDGKKMAVSLLTLNQGNIKTTIAFYNFDSVGQNEIDNIVGSYSYSDMIFPRIEFLTNDTMVAFGNGRIVIFEGTQKPAVKKELVIDKEMQSIFYNGHYFGITYNKENSENYHVAIYDLRGVEEQTVDFSMDYDEIEFLDNDEICIRNGLECLIITRHGIEKFRYEFDRNIFKILSTNIGRDYIFLMDGTTDKVRIKVNEDS